MANWQITSATTTLVKFKDTESDDVFYFPKNSLLIKSGNGASGSLTVYTNSPKYPSATFRYVDIASPVSASLEALIDTLAASPYFFSPTSGGGGGGNVVDGTADGQLPVWNNGAGEYQPSSTLLIEDGVGGTGDGRFSLAYDDGTNTFQIDNLTVSGQNAARLRCTNNANPLQAAIVQAASGLAQLFVSENLGSGKTVSAAANEDYFYVTYGATGFGSQIRHFELRENAADARGTTDVDRGMAAFLNTRNATIQAGTVNNAVVAGLNVLMPSVNNTLGTTNLYQNGGLITPPLVVNADTTLGIEDLCAVTTTTAITFTLPPTPFDGETHHIKNLAGGDIFIDPNGETIDLVAGVLALGLGNAIKIVYSTSASTWIVN